MMDKSAANRDDPVQRSPVCGGRHARSFRRSGPRLSPPLDPSRRSFLALAAGVAASCALRPSSAAVSAAATEKYPPGRYFDMHTHLGQTWNTTKPLSAAELLKWMDANDVSQAVVLPLVSPEASSFPLSTQFVLEQTKPHRDRLIPFCCIDPRTTINGGKKGLDDMLARYADEGCRGFGEYKPGLPVDDLLSMRLYAACGRAGLPVLFHVDNLRNTDKPGLPGLEAALKQNPQTVFIGHGPGFWASISADVKTPMDLGGYPKGEVVAGGALDRLMGKYDNLYGEISAGSGAGALKRDPKFAADFLVRRQDRILFGSDYLSPGQPVPQFEVLKSMDLPEAVRAKIERENARKLLKL